MNFINKKNIYIYTHTHTHIHALVVSNRKKRKDLEKSE